MTTSGECAYLQHGTRHVYNVDPTEEASQGCQCEELKVPRRPAADVYPYHLRRTTKKNKARKGGRCRFGADKAANLTTPDSCGDLENCHTDEHHADSNASSGGQGSEAHMLRRKWRIAPKHNHEHRINQTLSELVR